MSDSHCVEAPAAAVPGSLIILRESRVRKDLLRVRRVTAARNAPVASSLMSKRPVEMPGSDFLRESKFLVKMPGHDSLGEDRLLIKRPEFDCLQGICVCKKCLGHCRRDFLRVPRNHPTLASGFQLLCQDPRMCNHTYLLHFTLS